MSTMLKRESKVSIDTFCNVIVDIFLFIEILHFCLGHCCKVRRYHQVLGMLMWPYHFFPL